MSAKYVAQRVLQSKYCRHVIIIMDHVTNIITFYFSSLCPSGPYRICSVLIFVYHVLLCSCSEESWTEHDTNLEMVCVFWMHMLQGPQLSTKPVLPWTR